MSQKSKMHPALGKMPKAAAGKCGPGMGKDVGSVDNTRGMNPTAYAGGKGHPSTGRAPRTPNPAPISHAVPGGKTTNVSGW